MDKNQVIAAYRQMRDRKDAMKKRHQEELHPINEAMDKMEAWLLRELTKDKLDSFKGKAGTAFQMDEVSVTVDDRDAFFTWVIENNAWAFIESRASKQIVQEFVEEHKQIPPGLNYKKDKVVRVRKS